MPRPPLDQLSQDMLVAELKIALDAARHYGVSTELHTRAVIRIAELLGDNQRASLREHVRHNLGVARRAFLAGLAGRLELAAVQPQVRFLGR